MFERFTDNARHAVVVAQEESRELGHDYIGTEHLLLGLLRADGIAASVLDELDVSVDAARADVLEIIGRGAGRAGGHIPFTPRAKKVLEYSLREAVGLGHHYIGTEHILLGILREGEGVASTVLVRAGVSLVETREKVVARVQVRAATGTEDVSGSDRVEAPIDASTSATVRADGVEDFLAPTCPGCRAAIEETGAFKVLDLPEDGGTRRVKVQIVYCEACGRTLTSRIVDE